MSQFINVKGWTMFYRSSTRVLSRALSGMCWVCIRTLYRACRQPDLFFHLQVTLQQGALRYSRRINTYHNLETLPRAMCSFSNSVAFLLSFSTLSWKFNMASQPRKAPFGSGSLEIRESTGPQGNFALFRVYLCQFSVIFHCIDAIYRLRSRALIPGWFKLLF